MPDYEAMYKQLFNTATKAIELLQEAQRETEEMYISDTGVEDRQPITDSTGNTPRDHE